MTLTPEAAPGTCTTTSPTAPTPRRPDASPATGHLDGLRHAAGIGAAGYQPGAANAALSRRRRPAT